MSAKIIKVGNIIRLIVAKKTGIETYDVEVNWVEPRGTEEIYFGYTPLNSNYGHWGCTTWRSTPRQFGLQNVEFIKVKGPVPQPWYPRPGDRGYDLMH